MDLLLLLSAFLTALTGAITGARPVQGASTEQQVERMAAAVARSVSAVKAASVRPLAGWPAARQVPVIGAVLALLPAQPLYAQRRRE